MNDWKDKLLQQLQVEYAEAVKSFDYSEVCRLRRDIAELADYDPQLDGPTDYDPYWDEEDDDSNLLEGLVEPL